MKKLINTLLGKLGYRISKIDRTSDVEQYVSLYGKESVAKKSFYNAGAGGFYHPCWTNIDNQSEWYEEYRHMKAALIKYDLFDLKPLPVESNSAELVYTSHAIEHVTNDAVQNLFNESFRILKPGGIFRIVTPNVDLEYQIWRNKDRSYFYWAGLYDDESSYSRINLKIPLSKASTSQLFLENFASTASEIVSEGSAHRITDEELERVFSEMKYEDALDYCISKCSVDVQKKFPFHHINWFNKDKLFRMLLKAGFTNIYLSAYGQSLSPVLRNLNYFDCSLPKVSLYVEAGK